MTVQKFRSIEEMNVADGERWLACDDPALAEHIRRHWAMWSRMMPTAIPRGVRKYRSIEEANADRDRWESERIERIRAERLKK
ncbi:MAG: hypothetical protein ABI837_00670 [Acidobacteriota bacterium]